MSGYWGLSWQVIDCPKCGSPRGEKCRTLATGRTTDSHIPRLDAAHDFKKKNRNK